MTNKTAIGMVKSWVTAQRGLKAKSPRHRVVIDVGMESVHTPHPMDLVRQVHGEDTLRSLDAMRGIDLAEMRNAIDHAQTKPPGGAGGLGIIEETIAWTGARFAEPLEMGLFLINPLHTSRRAQRFDGNRQRINTVETTPKGHPDYLPLGEIVSISLNGKQTPVNAWLFTGFSSGDNFVPAIRLQVEGITGRLYPSCTSELNFDQMHVLGEAGFKVAKHFGLLGVEEPLADLVIGHDGHTALFKHQIYLWFLEKLKNKSQALEATRLLCKATIHAPQNGTVPRSTGDMVRRHYEEDAEGDWGMHGVDPGKPTNALFADMRLSSDVGVVSPIHLMVTRAEDRALRRGFAESASRLLPDDVSAASLKLFPDTLDVESWLGMGVIHVLDQYLPGWRSDLSPLSDMTTVDNLRSDAAFRRDIAEAFAVQEEHYFGLWHDHFPRRFSMGIPENAIVFASLRRATNYKIDLIKSFLRNYEVIEGIAQELDRPIFYLFGGMAHQDDLAAIGSLEQLLGLIGEINGRDGMFTADFLQGHDFEKAKWLFPGLARRGCWVGCTNPVGPGRSQGTEAFGPSYMKSAMNGMYVLGSHDGGAACLQYLPTVFLYGPRTFAGATSFHNDLWGNRAIGGQAETLLTHGFLSGLENVARRVDQDLLRFESGRGHQAPGLGAKIEAMFRVMSDWNGTVLMNAYLDR